MINVELQLKTGGAKWSNNCELFCDSECILLFFSVEDDYYLNLAMTIFVFVFAFSSILSLIYYSRKFNHPVDKEQMHQFPAPWKKKIHISADQGKLDLPDSSWQHSVNAFETPGLETYSNVSQSYIDLKAPYVSNIEANKWTDI